MAASLFEKLIASLPEISTQKVLLKGEHLIREGETEKHLYYIESGAVRAFILTEYEELTIRFGYEGSFINSLASYLQEKPSEIYIEAIRRTVVHAIPKAEVMKLVHESSQAQADYIKLLETTICQQMEREVDLLTVSPSERLQRVLQRSPHLFQQVPLKYIASYLRMTPETLSRVRNE